MRRNGLTLAEYTRRHRNDEWVESGPPEAQASVPAAAQLVYVTNYRPSGRWSRIRPHMIRASMEWLAHHNPDYRQLLDAQASAGAAGASVDSRFEVVRAAAEAEQVLRVRAAVVWVVV